MSSNLGILWIVATPLGNPGDLSERARNILSTVDGVLAEDTRRAGALFARCGITAKAFTSFHDHNEQGRLPQVIGWLEEGKNLAVVSDAGTPLLSDPGYRLVRACREQGIRVCPVPGPSAPAAALSASGLPPLPFAFLGFPPRKDAEKTLFFTPYADVGLTLVFFERKDRLKATLRSACSVLGQDREVCVARELTKPYEEFIYLRLGEWENLPENLLGEMTIIIGPALICERTDISEVDIVLEEEASLGGKMRDVARRAATRLRGWTGKELYNRLQEIGNRARV